MRALSHERSDSDSRLTVERAQHVGGDFEEVRFATEGDEAKVVPHGRWIHAQGACEEPMHLDAQNALDRPERGRGDAARSCQELNAFVN